MRQLAKATAARSSARGQDYAAAIAARWGARLSALLIRGNAAVQRKARVVFPLVQRLGCEGAGSLPHSLPEGECLYELGCVAEFGSD